ncbi:L-allo-threonine aldolase [subsurface metagenome]|jgi:threonine aldolase
MKVIDLRSDTITLPTEEMRRAMCDADVGDDVYGEDPTVNHLEEMAADMLGKEAALFTPSGTMSNLIAVLTHTRPGNEILLGSEAHMFWYEVGGASALGGVVMRTVPNDQDGRMDPDAIAGAIRSKNIHFSPTTLLCLENTHNRCGGAVLTPEYTSTVAGLVHEYGLQVHLDGARIFNAAVALDIPASELAKPADSVCFCLSKGLSAPVGSLLCGTREFVEKARKWRKMMGGGMRQAGVIAVAGIVALQKMVSRLAVDHDNARHLAHGLACIPSIVIHPEKVQTNIVIFEPPTTIPGAEFVQRMDVQGIKLLHRGGCRMRAVTHRMISAADVDEVLNRIELLVKEMG